MRLTDFGDSMIIYVGARSVYNCIQIAVSARSRSHILQVLLEVCFVLLLHVLTVAALIYVLDLVDKRLFGRRVRWFMVVSWVSGFNLDFHGMQMGFWG